MGDGGFYSSTPYFLCCLVWIGVVGWALSGNRHTGEGRRRVQHHNVFCLCVTVIFPSEEKREEFKKLFAPLAQYVREKEMDTLSYILMQSDKDPLRIQILERYKSKEPAYLTTHRSSPQFLEFRAKMAKLVESKDITSVDGHSYLESAAGFV